MRDREAEIRELFPMLRFIAKRIARMVPGCDVGDLIGDGSVGLIRAVDSFDPARGVPLRSYAKRIVVGAMLNGVRRMDPVSERVRRTLRRAEAARLERAHATGSLPSLREMEDVIPGLARARADAHRHVPLSLDGPLSPEEFCEERGSADPADVVVRRAEREAVARGLAALPKRQRRLLYLHYWDGASLRSVSREMMVSPQRVSQLHLAALEQMRRAMQHERHSGR
ncbi:MAG TPA: sigma-70 family RNA polymerase sigma factor [Candidatus Acidoferrales bacterium]|nr:sigma-70 family RNA polymerase sigma factor [Candidatus Acidoferrales bacterium]